MRKTNGRVGNQPGYREAIEWLAYNDDNFWVKDLENWNDYDEEAIGLSVTAACIRDLYQVSQTKLIQDLKRALEKMEKD